MTEPALYEVEVIRFTSGARHHSVFEFKTKATADMLVLVINMSENATASLKENK